MSSPKSKPDKAAIWYGTKSLVDRLHALPDKEREGIIEDAGGEDHVIR